MLFALPNAISKDLALVRTRKKFLLSEKVERAKAVSRLIRPRLTALGDACCVADLDRDHP